jgi:hypothetical protein
MYVTSRLRTTIYLFINFLVASTDPSKKRQNKYKRLKVNDWKRTEYYIVGLLPQHEVTIADFAFSVYTL